MVSIFNYVFAQSTSNEELDTACAECMGALIFIVVVAIAINLAILVWVTRDSKARGMGTPIGWMLLVFFTSIFGLIIYIFSRPKGNLIVCEHCKNKRLKAMAKCPHCGN